MVDAAPDTEVVTGSPEGQRGAVVGAVGMAGEKSTMGRASQLGEEGGGCGGEERGGGGRRGRKTRGDGKISAGPRLAWLGFSNSREPDG